MPEERPARMYQASLVTKEILGKRMGDLRSELGRGLPPAAWKRQLSRAPGTLTADAAAPPCWRCLRVVVQAIVQRLCLISCWHGKLNKMVEDEVLDRTYAALADPTRRAMLVALRTGDARITDLAAPLPMTFAGVSRHIGVLESAGLVQRAVRGREHWLSIRPEGLSAPESWINEQTAFWSRRADALASRLARKKSAGD